MGTPDQSVSRALAASSESLDGLRTSTEADVRGLIKWYDAKNKRKKRLSFLYRGATIISSTLGVLIPLLAPALPEGWRSNVYHYGYFSAVLAIFFITIDRQFGFTSSWVRTIKAQRQLDTALAEFRMNWAKLTVTLPRSSDETFAQCMKDFALQARAVADKEADTWATETLANFGQLEKAVATGAEEARKRYESALEALRPGAMEITLKNPPQGAWHCSISINGQIRKQNWCVPTCGIVDVVPGNVEVLVEAETANQDKWIGSRAVVVASGPPSAVLVELSRIS